MANGCPSCGFENLQGDDRCEMCLHSLMVRDLPRAKKDDRYQNIMMSAPVENLMVDNDLLMCNGEDNLQKVVEIFQKKKKNCVLVMDKHQLVGIVSFRDLLMKIAGKDNNLSEIATQKVMTSNPECVKVSDPIAFLINKMSVGGFRHVPVLDHDGKTPIGILSIKDVLKYLDERD